MFFFKTADKLYSNGTRKPLQTNSSIIIYLQLGIIPRPVTMANEGVFFEVPH